MFYVITHKDVEETFSHLSPTSVLHVGMEPSSDVSYLFDSTGDSISEKNPYYCELTGLYWIWKNGPEKPDDIVSIEHYRRYFDADNARIEKLLEDNEIILPGIYNQPGSVEIQYGIHHRIEDLNVLRKLLSEMYPDCLEAYDSVMGGEWMYVCNMMICRKEVFDRYCSWLFPLLFAYEKIVDASQIEDPYQRRLYGFLSERLLKVWTDRNCLKCAEVKLIRM